MNAAVLPVTANARILVAGDVMLDRYWFGDVARISPEAPVPVAKVERTEDRPGGAANVALNVAALGAQTTILSVIGLDEPGKTLTELLAATSVKASLKTDEALATTVKLRVIARQQQLIRIDFENAPAHEALLSKLQDFEQRLQEHDMVILSDYGKGGLTHIERMIALARNHGKRILVDPKGDDYRRYAGATLLTPNRTELREVVGRWSSEADLTEKVSALRQALHIDAVLLTRSEEGMSLFDATGVTHESAQAREVYDVSGAGDTVIATMGVMLAAGLDMRSAMRLANRAAAVVVGKLGAATCTLAELQALAANL